MSLADKFYLEYSKLREKLKFQLIPTQKSQSHKNLSLLNTEGKGLSIAFVNQDVAIDVDAERMEKFVIPNAMEASLIQINIDLFF